MRAEGYKDLINILRTEKVKTWFDIGLFLDRLRGERECPSFPKEFDDFKEVVGEQVSFITFDFGIDGVSVEIAKYIESFKTLLPNAKFSCIGGHFSKETETLLPEDIDKHILRDARGFDAWDGYNSYFHSDLKRGGDQYNKLAKLIWEQTCAISIRLADLVVTNKISMLAPVNINSNPGNIPLALSVVLVSEYLNVPVMASHHDFYWESGRKAADRKAGEKEGLRDHFFRNSSIGEVQSIIDLIFPWSSPLWFHTVINSVQKTRLMHEFGFNPSSVMKIPTSIDLNKYKARKSTEVADIKKRIKLVLSKGEKKLYAQNVFNLPEDCAHIKGTGESYLFGNEDGIEAHIRRSNFLLVQPTRIIKRKQIEHNFDFINRLLKASKFNEFFSIHKELTITLLVTGPIATGHDKYFNFLISSYKTFLQNLPEEFRNRIFLGFMFGIENKDVLKRLDMDSLRIEEIYSAASLITLPSETEGRGLPIIESAASQVPIICNRYTPEHVYSEVIGENKDESSRLKVIELQDGIISDKNLQFAQEVFIDPDIVDSTSHHNREVVIKRYSKEHLTSRFDKALHSMWAILHSDQAIDSIVESAFDVHNSSTVYNDAFDKIVLNQNRKYLPGITTLEFMVYLKSLIDPSFFRIEEMHLKGRIFDFAERLVEIYSKDNPFSSDTNYDKIMFYRTLERLFTYNVGTDELAIDHSLSYRYRNRKHFLYRKITEQELCGVVGEIFRNIYKGDLELEIKSKPSNNLFDLKSSIVNFARKRNNKLGIDFSDRLYNDLISHRPFGLIPGHYYEHEIKVFVVDVMKERLGISLDDDLTDEFLSQKDAKEIGTASFYVREKPLNDISANLLMKWIENDASKDVQLLYKHGFLKIVVFKGLSRGLHLGQLGSEAQNDLLNIQAEDGFLVASTNSSFMLDMIDISTYHIGQVKTELFANFMGLKMEECYILWAPRGLKPSLAYPTPIQSPKSFALALQSDLFDQACRVHGEKKVLEVLRKDSDEYGNPVKVTLNSLVNADTEKSSVFSSVITGIHEDGLPWSGAMVKVALNDSDVDFKLALSGATAKPVVNLISEYEASSGSNVTFAWNGGYILNNELVGKLALPEDYIGTPLGLVCSDSKIKAMPLYNKATLLIDSENKLDFQRVNLFNGFRLKTPSGEEHIFDSSQRNLESSDGPIFYDLLFDEDKDYHYDGRIIYRFIGNEVSEIIESPTSNVKVIPVGLTISTPVSAPLNIKVGDQVDFILSDHENINVGIEAGPMLIEDSKIAIDMPIEGWKTSHSIATQAARLDFTDMRGPKMAAGITKDNELVLVAINGRIRESVGATHIDVAQILLNYGCEKAMGFDPGGSVTLIVNGEQLNISPYNKNYEQNIFSLSPEARFVGNAILGIC